MNLVHFTLEISKFRNLGDSIKLIAGKNNNIERIALRHPPMGGTPSVPFPYAQTQE